MSFLNTIDAQRRRESRVVNPFAPPTSAPNGVTTPGADPRSAPAAEDDVPESHLQAATKILSEVNADHMLNTGNLEKMNEQQMRHNAALTTPPPDVTTRNGTRTTNKSGAPHSATSSTSMSYSELDHMVYPIGQTNGIDPMYSEHVHNIPYPLPSKADGANTQPPEGRKKSTAIDPGWIRQPQILLVEDDPTCRRIGGKFLYAFHCSIDSAVSDFCEPI